MHELYIAECVLNSTQESLPDNVLSESVQEIHVQVGQLDAVVPEALTFSFDAIKGSYGMPKAELTIETIGVLCRCSDCDYEFTIDLPLFLCPNCGSGQVKVLQGRGITLTRIIAEES